MVKPVRVLGVYGGPKLRNTHANGDQVASVVTIFECRTVDETVPSPDGLESLDAKFFPAAEALSLLSKRWQKRMGFAFERHTTAHFEAATWQPWQK